MRRDCQEVGKGTAVNDNLSNSLEGFYIGNVIKYRHKNGVEDLRKARWYLECAIGLVGSRDKGDE